MNEEKMSIEERQELLGDLDGIWLVKFPVHKYYKESIRDIKRLGKRNHLKIINAKFSKNISPELLIDKPPKLTLIEIETKSDATAKEQEEALSAVEEAKRLAAAADAAKKEGIAEERARQEAKKK